jgi:uncharacterized protein
MIGTLLNAAAIVVGGVAGLTTTRQLSPVNQTALKILMGVFTTYVGLSMVWQGLNGTFAQVLKQLGIVLLALILGNVTGKLLRLQKSLNRLGQHARQRLSNARPDGPHRINDGFVTCSILFCVSPMAFLGGLHDGLGGNYKILATKAVMDGLATMAFVTTFGWGAIMSALPVVACQGTITLLAKTLQPFLETHVLLDSINATGGFLVFSIALIILELKKVELADYLPSLAYAPLLTWLWR